MPHYDFKCEVCGTIREEFHSILNVPKEVPCYNEIDVDGVMDQCHGVAHRVLGMGIAGHVDTWKPYVSNRLPRNLKGCRCTPDGKPIIESRSQERNIMARDGYARE